MRRTIASVIAFCFLGLCVSPICQAIEITDCGSTLGKFNSVTLKGCDMSKSVCDLIRDTNASIEIDFTTESEVTSVIAVVHGILMDIPVPFPLPNPNACTTPDSGIQCPLSKGGMYQYKTTLPVLKSYPKVAVTIKWELRNDKNQDIICILIPAKVK